MKRHIPFILLLVLIAFVCLTAGAVSGFAYQHRSELKGGLAELANVVTTSVRVIIRGSSETATSTPSSTLPTEPLRPIGELKTYTNKKYGFSFDHPADFAPFFEYDGKGGTGCAIRMLFHRKEYVDTTKNVLRPEPRGTPGAMFSVCLASGTTTLDMTGRPYASLRDYAKSRGSWLQADEAQLSIIQLAGREALRFAPKRSSVIGYVLVRFGQNKIFEVYDGLFGYEKRFLDIFIPSFKIGT